MARASSRPAPRRVTKYKAAKEALLARIADKANSAEPIALHTLVMTLSALCEINYDWNEGEHDK
jgi:hypothetical protein